MNVLITAIGEEVYVHPHALVESNKIGRGTRIWAFAHVMEGARIGERCNICDHVFIESGAILGNGVTVKNGVAVWDKVTIEDDVFLGPNCVLTNDLNPRAAIRKAHDELAPTWIRANVTIGANATIVCGVTVGSGAFIGAGSVVIRSVPDFALMVGNPARQTGWACICAKKLKLSTTPPVGGSVSCKFCRRSFIVTESGLTLNVKSEKDKRRTDD
jgi:acetyltransferase-like isoleucine patch superfamily enzyme